MNFFLKSFLAIVVYGGFQMSLEACQSKTLCSIEEPRIKALYDTCASLPKELILLIAMYDDESLWRHKANVCSMAELADGTVAVGLENGAVEIRTLHCAPTPPYGLLKVGVGHVGPVTLLAQTSSGTLLSGSTLHGRPIAKMDIRDQVLTYYSFDQTSPNNTDFDERIKEWDLKTGAQVRALIPTRSSGYPLRETNTLWLSSLYCKLSGKDKSPLWGRAFRLDTGVHTQEELWEVDWGKKLPDYCCAGLETEKIQILGCKNGQICVHDKKQNADFILSGHSGAITVLKLDKAEKWLISGSADCTIRFWSLDTRTCQRVINAHKAPIRTLAPLSTGEIISSSGTKSLMHEPAKLLRSKL